MMKRGQINGFEQNMNDIMRGNKFITIYFRMIENQFNLSFKMSSFSQIKKIGMNITKK